MRKQVHYHQLNSVYGPYGGRVRPIPYLKRITVYFYKVIRGPEIWKFGHVTQTTPTKGSFYGPYAEGTSSVSVPNLKRIAQFVQKS